MRAISAFRNTVGRARLPEVAVGCRFVALSLLQVYFKLDLKDGLSTRGFTASGTLNGIGMCNVCAFSFQGVVTAATSLITTLAQKNPEEFKTSVSLAVSRLSRVSLWTGNETQGGFWSPLFYAINILV